jgi:hypothetical protein
MTGLEDLLHEAMVEHTRAITTLTPGAAYTAITRARRVRWIQLTAASIATATVVGAGATVLAIRPWSADTGRASVDTFAGSTIIPGSKPTTGAAPPTLAGRVPNEAAIEAAKATEPPGVTSRSGSGDIDALFGYTSAPAGSQAADRAFTLTTQTMDAAGINTFVRRMSGLGCDVQAGPAGWPRGTTACIIDRRPSYYQVLLVHGTAVVNLVAEVNPSSTLMQDWARRIANRLR